MWKGGEKSLWNCLERYRILWNPRAKSHKLLRMPSDPADPNSVVGQIRTDYDTLAEDYSRAFYHELDAKPFDRKMLDDFASRVLGLGEVLDLGSGPGQIARYLSDRGVKASGLDLSPRMVQEAQRLNPQVSFRTGNMLALDLPDHSLAGITAFYAIVNLPKSLIEAAFREMHRVLKVNGFLLLAFHVGEDEVLHDVELLGHKISMDFSLLRTGEIVRQLRTLGFHIEKAIEREPYPEVEYPSTRAYVLARKKLAVKFETGAAAPVSDEEPTSEE